MFSLNSRGSFKNMDTFLMRMLKRDIYAELESLAQEGVYALQSLTPKDSGVTSDSWGYEIEQDSRHYRITWTNSNMNDGVNIAIILQYGHGTGTGGYVQGIDYINPALRSTFDKIADSVWKAVVNA